MLISFIFSHSISQRTPVVATSLDKSEAVKVVAFQQISSCVRQPSFSDWAFPFPQNYLSSIFSAPETSRNEFPGLWVNIEHVQCLPILFCNPQTLFYFRQQMLFFCPFIKDFNFVPDSNVSIFETISGTFQILLSLLKCLYGLLFSILNDIFRGCSSSLTFNQIFVLLKSKHLSIVVEGYLKIFNSEVLHSFIDYKFQNLHSEFNLNITESL